jgi:uncharacterized protein YcfL
MRYFLIFLIIIGCNSKEVNSTKKPNTALSSESTDSTKNITYRNRDQIGNQTNIAELDKIDNSTYSVIDTSTFNYVYDLKGKDDEHLGKVFIKEVHDSLFNELKIIKDNNLIYHINKTEFSNINGTDIRTRKDNFHGWSFLLKKDDYFVLNLYYNLGRNVGDNVNLKWNYDEKVFEVLKSP